MASAPDEEWCRSSPRNFRVTAKPRFDHPVCWRGEKWNGVPSVRGRGASYRVGPAGPARAPASLRPARRQAWLTGRRSGSDRRVNHRRRPGGIKHRAPGRASSLAPQVARSSARAARDVAHRRALLRRSRRDPADHTRPLVEDETSRSRWRSGIQAISSTPSSYFRSVLRGQ